MQPADDLPVENLLGKRVVFKRDAEHDGCWHFRVGLVAGRVVKIGQTLAQKAALMGPDSPIPAELLEAAEETPRVWVKVDPCELFPRGCEVAVEKTCLNIEGEHAAP
jgi:hypothetical protein